VFQFRISYSFISLISDHLFEGTSHREFGDAWKAGARRDEAFLKNRSRVRSEFQKSHQGLWNDANLLLAPAPPTKPGGGGGAAHYHQHMLGGLKKSTLNFKRFAELKILKI
jgi:hypothetical protein